ncbi:thiol-activated cytolysin family protein [Sphingobacterium cellulitidis]|uniref:thiol-activated cytolysin family protein n=1 Tax=Sphingobacterium cellulitidis TaxID=1768011 RepID=UPI0015C5F722|nr:thiol-activated cytolysin family protein [Sphingobacterium cellulitidis]
MLNKADINQDEYNVLDLIHDDITMSFVGPPVKSNTFKAGKDNMYQSINSAFSSSSNLVFSNNSSFSYNLQELSQYKDIENYLGQTINLQEWFAISPDTQKPNTVLALDLKRTAFTVSLDLPSKSTFATDPNELTKYNREDLIYVNSLAFGRRIIILIESYLDKDTLQKSLKSLLESEKLSENDEAILANCTFRTVVLGADELTFIPQSPIKPILEYINKEFNSNNYGMPISFDAAYLKDNSIFENKF